MPELKKIDFKKYGLEADYTFFEGRKTFFKIYPSGLKNKFPAIDIFVGVPNL